jgi:hypothetical protein
MDQLHRRLAILTCRALVATILSSAHCGPVDSPNQNEMIDPPRSWMIAPIT